MARIKFAIEPDALLNDNPSTDQETDFLRLRISTLLDFWASFGTLVDPDSVYEKLGDGTLAWDYDSLQIMESWLRPLMAGGSTRAVDLVLPLGDEGAISWNDITNNGSMAQMLPYFDLALVGQRIADQLGSHRQSCIHCPSNAPDFIDVVSWIRGVSLSCQVQELEEIDKRRTIEVQPICDLWTERFQSLAKRSEEAVIIDRYAVLRSIARSGANRGLCNLLNLIDEHSNIRNITVYSSYNAQSTGMSTPPPLSAIRNSLTTEVGGLNLQNVELVTVYLPSNYHFGDEGKDRFIRFDSIACTLGHGLEVFEGEDVPAGTSFALLMHADDRKYVKDLEAHLKGETSPQNIIQLPVS